MRLAELQIRGLRTLAKVTLSLGGVTVLIGDNGAGKSSILEALRIARLVTMPDFLGIANHEHVLGSAIRRDARLLRLAMRIESGTRNLVYTVEVDGQQLIVTHESIYELPLGMGLDEAAGRKDLPLVIGRLGDMLHYSDRDNRPNNYVAPRSSLFEYIGRDNPTIEEVRGALSGIDTHLPFQVSASWANRSTGRSSGLREGRMLEPADRLQLFGVNLANVYHTLKNSSSERWQETLELLQLGLGPQVRDVLAPAMAGGQVSLSLELRGIGAIPAIQLADGQLAYLAFVGLIQLDPGRTLLSFDEPEQHLHPALLGRVMQLFMRGGSRYPVLLATHSDRLLDLLPDPCAAVRVCELDSNSSTRLLGLDRNQLDIWLKRYRGLGDLRAAGQLESVMANEDSAA